MQLLHTRLAPWLTGVLTFVLLVAGGLWTVMIAEEGRSGVVDGITAAQTAEVHEALQHELRATVSLAQGLRSFFAAVPEVADTDHPLAARVDPVITGVYADGDHLRNIGVAPDNQIRYVHPLAGNEAVIGLRYEDVPEQLSAVQRAIESRTSVLAGPVDLVQGGRGLINRTPVFLDDGSYWGVVSLVIDADSLFDAVDAAVETDQTQWGVIAGTGDESRLIAGSEAVLDGPVTSRIDVQLPGTEWEVRGGPSPEALARTSAGYQRAGVVAVAAVIAGLVTLVLLQRRQARQLAVHDSLTGLPNRRLLELRLAHLVASSQRAEDPWTLLAIDLDGFKPVNDRYGHAAGDDVLRTIAERLEGGTRPGDTVARVGGDEFIVVLPDADRDGAEVMAERIRNAIHQPIRVDAAEVVLDASIGLAVHPDDGTTAADLLARADAMMYEAKTSERTTAPRGADDGAPRSASHP